MKRFFCKYGLRPCVARNFPLFVMALLTTLATSSAESFDFAGKRAFVVDRCGGDYACDDAELVLIDSGSSKATIIRGKQDTSFGADGSPTHNNGYSFADETHVINIIGSPPTITVAGVTTPFKNQPYLTLESDRVFIFLSSTGCDVCGSITLFFTRGMHGNFNAVLVDKKTGNVLNQNVEVGSTCLKCEKGPSDTVAACQGKMQFLIAEHLYIISGDPCADDQLKLTVRNSGGHSTISKVEDRPHAF